MRVPYGWLREFVDGLPAAEELAERLTMAGLAVEAVERLAPGFSGVVVGRVLEVAPHPRADRLRVCRVDVGGAARADGRPVGGPLSIVCGAPNVGPGQLVPVALPGARLPDGTVIGRRAIRGVESEGMICSARELGQPDPTGGTGIWVLPPGDLSARPAPGAELTAAMDLEETVLVLDLTPNYATHCQSVLGVAREAAAVLGLPLRDAWAPPRQVEEPCAATVRVSILDPDLCPRYVARVVRGVRVGPSPAWLRRRLEAAGMRSINNVVDVTNYVMLERGQPLHAFDRRRLRAAADGATEIVVRRARAGETMVTLDGVERRLEKGDLLICDAAGPVAVAGVMGGLSSEVGEDTDDVLLESAFFAPEGVRRTARRLGIRSEAALRFERWVDPLGCASACARAAALIQELAGGEVPAGEVDARHALPEQAVIPFEPAAVARFLGVSLTPADVAGYLARLGFAVEAGDPEGRSASGAAVGGDESASAGGSGAPTVGTGGGPWVARAPSWRPDVARWQDLAEEVARLHGYERIPARLPASPVEGARPDRRRELARAARSVCLQAGYSEAVTFSFHGEDLLDRLGLPADDPRRRAVRLANPLAADQAVLRTMLLPGLLQAAGLNARRQQRDVALFEVGRVYGAASVESMAAAADHPPPLTAVPDEGWHLAAVVAGEFPRRHWSRPAQQADLFDVKGLVEEVAERLGLAVHARPGAEPARIVFVPAQEPGFHPGRCARVLLRRRDGREEQVGLLGELHPGVAAAFELPPRCCAVELELEPVLAEADPVRAYSPLPRFPAANRDLAALVREEVSAERVAEVVRRAGRPYLEEAWLFDLYRGEPVPPGWRSLAYRLVYRAPDRTLTDAEVEEAHRRVRDALAAELGAVPRS